MKTNFPAKTPSKKKHPFWFSILISSQDKKIKKIVGTFFGRSFGWKICFRNLLTFRTSVRVESYFLWHRCEKKSNLIILYHRHKRGNHISRKKQASYSIGGICGDLCGQLGKVRSSMYLLIARVEYHSSKTSGAFWKTKKHLKYVKPDR